MEKEWESKWTEIHKGWPEKWVKKRGMQEIILAGEDGKRFAQAYYDYHWADVIAKSPVNGPKLKKLADSRRSSSIQYSKPHPQGVVIFPRL